MQPSVVDPDEYLGEHANPATIYEPGSEPLLLPLLDVRFEPMERLMLVNSAIPSTRASSCRPSRRRTVASPRWRCSGARMAWSTST
jgi:hypothetical protein